MRRAVTAHHGLMAGTMTWMVVAMPMGTLAAVVGIYFLLAAVFVNLFRGPPHER